MSDSQTYGQLNKESPFKFVQEHPDRFLWGLAIAPAITSGVALLIGLPPLYGALCVLIPNILMALLDEKFLKRTNRPVPAHWTVFVVPVYIWQRIKLTGLQKIAFYVWCAAFVASIYFNHLSSMRYLERTACGLVTEILHKNLGSGAAECVSVEIMREKSSGFYKAGASLDNGNDMDITIDTRKSGQIYVQLSN
jgi:hypothetical protein